MIRHTVLFRFEESVTDDQVAAMSAALDALPAAIAEIVAYRHGRDLGVGADNFQYVITADFASLDDFASYRDHAEHQRFIAEHITGCVTERAAAQFEFD